MQILDETQAPSTRPHIRNFFFPDTTIVHTHTANSQANPEIFESDNISDTCGRSNRDIF